jgi:hypothetical protein
MSLQGLPAPASALLLAWHGAAPGCAAEQCRAPASAAGIYSCIDDQGRGSRRPADPPAPPRSSGCSTRTARCDGVPADPDGRRARREGSRASARPPKPARRRPTRCGATATCWRATPTRGAPQGARGRAGHRAPGHQGQREAPGDLAAERKPLLDEAEFYVGKPLPPKLRNCSSTPTMPRSSAQREAAVSQEAELERVNEPLRRRTGAPEAAVGRRGAGLAGADHGTAHPLAGGEPSNAEAVDAALISRACASAVVGLRRVGLALAGLHHLADQRVEGLVLAGAVLVHRLGVGGEHLVDDGFQRAGCRSSASGPWPRSAHRRRRPRRPTAHRRPGARRCSTPCRRPRADQRRQHRRPTGPGRCRALGVQPRETSPISQLAASLGCRRRRARLRSSARRPGSASSSPRRRRAGRRRAGSARPSPRAARASRAARVPPTRRDHQRRQVGVGEVAVVVRVFLAAHRARLAGVGVEQHGGLLDGQAVLDAVDLPLHLEVDGLLQEAEAVEVLDLAPRAQFGAPGRRTETLASQRKLPSCMLPSQMPSHTTSACSALAYSTASALLRMSGSVTISSSGVPARFRSMPVCRGSPRAATCRRLPPGARASGCTRLRLPSSGSPRWPPCTTGISYWLIW